MEATLPNGYKTNQVMCFAVGKNYSTRAMNARSASPAITTLSVDDGIAVQAAESYYARLKGFTWQIQDDKILLGSAYDTNDPDLRFTFKSYNLDTKKWEVLDSNKKSNWQTWKPYKGNYWVYCQATTSDGKSCDQTMCFAVGKNYASYVNLNGFTWQMQDDRILIGSAYDTNDSGTQFSFKAYNLDTQKWETLSTYKSSNWQTWKPYKGNYWIYCQAKTSTGYTTDQVMCFAVGKDYGPYVHLNGYTWQMKSDAILVGSAYNTNDSDVKFAYKSYNLTTKQWQSLSDNSSSNWVTWKPERGNYWIYCQAKTSNGYTSDQTMCFAVSEDYSGNLYRIMGSSSITVDQMVNFYENGKGNVSYDTFGESQYNGCLTQGGAPDIRTYCQIFKEEAENEGVKVEVAFTQAMLETGYLKFGGDVKPDQYNFAGIGATGNGNPGNSFGDVRTGIRAQIQHLKCYASTDSLNLAKVDPRWSNNLRGKAIYVEYLSIPNNPYGTGWAASATYGNDLLKLITNLYKC
ncbi:glucosaminidase domain-containing protein [Faecalibacillus faecis]|uniref:glucosaminidase domain-containing protein n=1 Tax=Faecalibacillus faecis TaxID=1982628 RepID=UPI0022DF1C18|nr:glucosaminidase domain-containing protein [Faecalibacillus faecis]